MLFFIRSKIGWLVHMTCLAAVCPTAICTGIVGSLLKDESHTSIEESWLGEDLFRSQKVIWLQPPQSTYKIV